MLCRDCKHCKTKPVGHVSSRNWCEALPKKNRGIHSHLNTVAHLLISKHEKDWQFASLFFAYFCSKLIFILYFIIYKK